MGSVAFKLFKTSGLFPRYEWETCEAYHRCLVTGPIHSHVLILIHVEFEIGFRQHVRRVRSQSFPSKLAAK
jgi:hypothetical protein